MPTERMEVEVICPRHRGDDYGFTHCGVCDNRIRQEPGIIEATVPEGSLTAARLRLADAAEAKGKAYRARMERIEAGVDCSVDREYHEAVAAEELAEEQEEDAYEKLVALRAEEGTNAQ